MTARMLTTAIAAMLTVLTVAKGYGKERVFSFDQFAVTNIYKGPTRLPDLSSCLLAFDQPEIGFRPLTRILWSASAKGIACLAMLGSALLSRNY